MSVQISYRLERRTATGEWADWGAAADPEHLKAKIDRADQVWRIVKVETTVDRYVVEEFET